jgi:SNF2 family DNA or RNA helicase
MIRRRLEDIPDEDLSSLPEVMPPMNVEVELTKDQVKAYAYIQEHEQEIKEQVRKILKIDPDSKEKEDKDKIQLGYSQIKVGLSHSCEILMKSQSQMAKRIIKDCGIHDISSPKIDRAIELSKDIIETGSKIVIFTELRSVQNIMHEKLVELGIEHVVINKDVKAEDRETLKSKFKNDKNCKIFLTTDASKEGANLQAANYLINLDLPWKPSTYEQRMGRIRRMGSAFARCFIINMVSVAPKGDFETIDQIRLKTIIKKQVLIDQVVEGK